MKLKRVMYISNAYGGQDKYERIDEYEQFTIYQKVTPSGYFSHQDYLITDGSKVILSPSFNHLNKSELFDMVDDYLETGKLGKKVLDKWDKLNNIAVQMIHPGGEMA